MHTPHSHSGHPRCTLRTVTPVILPGFISPDIGRGRYEEEVEDVAELEEEVVLLFLVVDLPCA